jgi:hypothetical protein
LKVRSVADDDHAGRFSLRNNQMAPFNVFVSLKELSGLLRLPESCNRLLIAGIPTDTLPAGMIAQTIQRNWSLYDAGFLCHKHLLPASWSCAQAAFSFSLRYQKPCQGHS